MVIMGGTLVTEVDILDMEVDIPDMAGDTATGMVVVTEEAGDTEADTLDTVTVVEPDRGLDTEEAMLTTIHMVGVVDMEVGVDKEAMVHIILLKEGHIMVQHHKTNMAESVIKDMVVTLTVAPLVHNHNMEEVKAMEATLATATSPLTVA